MKLSCTIEIEMIMKRFEQMDDSGKLQLKKKLMELANPESTHLVEPIVKAKARGRPSRKLDTSTCRDPSQFEYVLATLDNHSQSITSSHQPNPPRKRKDYSDHYAKVFGYASRVHEVLHSLSYFESNPRQDHWMTMPETGHIIASKYNVVLVLLSKQLCLTFLPLRSVPLPQSLHKIITIGFVNGCHFIEVFMVPGSPMPHITANWLEYHHSCARGWETSYTNNIDAFKDLVFDGMTRETIDLNG
ncbi:hypothetical protein Dsin_010249 [Dipteronia sinensis]|uniref:Uncharacterized protein n=1 Tax=Dipteronia sinensis TaxID=43782 RepID=A0AAE0ECN7_9ROSI|nr:hypothetical protein Dsin_010249 [Dipteronia sinensis]